MLFIKQKLTWKSYITAKALLTIKQVKIIYKKEFAQAELDKHIEVFIVYITSLLIMVITN